MTYARNKPGTADGPSSDWLAAEPSLTVAASRIGIRLLVRARASWSRWTAAIFLLAALATAYSYRHPPPAATTVVLRLGEGATSPTGDPVSIGVLRAYVSDLAFSFPHLLDIARRHPAAFPDAERDPVTTVEDLRDSLSLSMPYDDMVEDGQGSGPATRSVRVEITFKSPFPEVAAAVAHELADLLVSSEVDRGRQAVEREGIARREAELLSGAHLAEGGPTDQGSNPRGAAATERARAALRRMVAAQLEKRSLEQSQKLNFYVVDSGGTTMREKGILPVVLRTVLGLPVLLFVGALLAGAFDPRLLDEVDVASLGVPILGHLHRRV